jgi:DNA invertase Pin-like site-specific DNA recombinase
LEQDFNSLDAQREAFEAYVASQKAEGWHALRDCYDDGGYSGGTLERPALRQLLKDIEDCHVAIVVVYKIDRLSRSLMDFARLVELFDRKSVTFVSVTQSFNTTTSMGRLTLNVLLSFAQFEREVTGERIRDKFAASKKKGMWMGGGPPLGYDVDNRKLVVNPAEAETVRLIYQRYLDLGCVRRLCVDLEERGLTSKRRVSAAGRCYGGKTQGPSALYLILNNRTYLGEVTHKGATYKGEHKPIVPRPMFDAVQRRLAEQAPATSGRARLPQDGPLAGLVFDETGAPMPPTYTIKNGNLRYRYYASRPSPKGRRSNAAIQRIPAPPFEAFIAQTLDRLGLPSVPATSTGGNPSPMIHRIDILPDSIWVAFDRTPVLGAWRKQVPTTDTPRDRDIVEAQRHVLATGETITDDGRSLILLLPVRARFRGGAAMLHGVGSNQASAPDATLLRAVARAWRWREMLLNGEVRSIEELAVRTGQDRGHLGLKLGLAFLDPAIVRAIVCGEQPPRLRLTRLLNAKLPSSWQAQEAMVRRLGDAAPG